MFFSLALTVVTKVFVVVVVVPVAIKANVLPVVSGRVSSHRQSRFGCSLRSFARTAHSAHLLRSAPLCSLARSIHWLAYSLRSLPHGTVEIHGYVFTLKMRFTGTIEILFDSRNTPPV